MKTLVITLAILLFAAPAIAAPFLGSDPHPGPIIPTQVQVETTPTGGTATIVPGTYILDAGKVKLLDLATYAPNKYTFRARWADATGWWSDWSAPFVAGKPNASGGLGIIP